MTPWSGGLVGINSFGFGGSNVHAILQTPETTTPTQVNENVHVCVPVSGRTEQSAKKMFELAR